jgi:hypothetical protein
MGAAPPPGTMGACADANAFCTSWICESGFKDLDVEEDERLEDDAAPAPFFPATSTTGSPSACLFFATVFSSLFFFAAVTAAESGAGYMISKSLPPAIDLPSLWRSFCFNTDNLSNSEYNMSGNLYICFACSVR